MNAFTTLRTLISTFTSCTKGATALEYALIASLVSIAILGGIQSLSGGLSSLFNAVSNAIQ